MNIQKLISLGALFVVNDSGGKDSQAMKAYLRGIVPAEQLVVIHAHLPEVEWEGTYEHVVKYSTGLEVHQVQAGKTFFEMVMHRRKFPDAQNRQCTSDLKRGPIDKMVRAISKRTGRKLIINCMGIRAEESSNRAKKRPFTINRSQSKAGRKWYNWYPIFNWKIAQVWQQIADAGQEPHWAYAQGMTRLSCCFCILASEADLKTAARLNPGLFLQYAAVERTLDFTLIMPGKGKQKRFLTDIVNPI